MNVWQQCEIGRTESSLWLISRTWRSNPLYKYLTTKFVIFVWKSVLSHHLKSVHVKASKALQCFDFYTVNFYFIRFSVVQWFEKVRVKGIRFSKIKKIKAKKNFYIYFTVLNINFLQFIILTVRRQIYLARKRRKKRLQDSSVATLKSYIWVISPIIDKCLYLTLFDLATTSWIFTIT